MISVVSMRDVMGRDVIIATGELFTAFCNEMNLGTFTFLDMTMAEISNLRSAYMAKGGTFPVTHESVREAFGL